MDLILFYTYIFEFLIIAELVTLFSLSALLCNTEEENVNDARFQVLTAVLLRIKFFWFVAFCSLKHNKIGCLTLNRKAVKSFLPSVTFYQSIW
jgi:hypothetical protein